MTKKPTVKSIIDSVDTVRVRFVCDIPTQEISKGDLQEFTEKDAKRLVKKGLAVFYDMDLQRDFDADETSKFIQDTFIDKKEMASHFMSMQPTFYDRAGLFWMWNKHEYRWDIIDDIDLMNLIDSKSPRFDTIKSKEKQEIVEALKRVGRQKIPEKAKETWVQFKDTIVDVKSGEHIDASPKYHITNPIPWKIGDSEDTPVLDKIFKEWVGEEYTKTLYEIIAYCTLPSYPIHRLFCFVGSGLNGKSKFLELIVRFVGSSNTTNTELDTLLNSRFEASKMFKKLVCVMGETNYSSISKTSLLKRLTGQDQIGYEFKQKNPFDDYNYAKILISTNSLPMTEDKTIGFYRRWLIINFPNKFSEKKDILEDIPDSEYENLAKKSITVLKSLLENRGFTNEGSVDERSKKYEDISNPLQKFIDVQIDIDPLGKAYKWEFRAAFVAWMIKRGYREWSEKEITIEMRKIGFEDKRDSGEERWRYWCGIVLKKSVQDVQDVQGTLLHTTRTETKSDPLDMLDKLDGWKKSGDSKATVSIGLLKNSYMFNDDEIVKLKQQGLIHEISPGKLKIVS